MRDSDDQAPLPGETAMAFHNGDPPADLAHDPLRDLLAFLGNDEDGLPLAQPGHYPHHHLRGDVHVVKCIKGLLNAEAQG
jgi:hypothetical protein